MSVPESTVNVCARDDPAAHDADHIHEFGDVPRLIHLPPSEKSDDEEQPVQPPLEGTANPSRLRWKRLGHRLYQPRHLMQYFYDDTLYRTRAIRKISKEELFLDLVFVATLASLGHELRAAPVSWSSIQKFSLLFAAVYSAWREAVTLWNLWGVHQDFLEKAFVYLMFASIVGIALGAHNAFDPGLRPYVPISAFLATAVPAVAGFVFASKERLLRNPANRTHQLKLARCFALASVLPYFAAAFVTSSQSKRTLYWIALAVQTLVHFTPHLFFVFLHRNVKNHTRVALNIELMVEKFEVLTMIVLGESVISILFEGSVISEEGSRIGFLYLSAIGATGMLYSLQTLYVQIDGAIPKGGSHALRHNKYAGLMWSWFHMPYHLFLILFATGLGISVRDIALPAAEEFVRVTTVGASGAAQFDTNARWLFATGWGGSIICSAIIGAMHVPGPRASTKLYRSVLRVVVVIGCMVGLPFSNMSAGKFVGIYANVTVLISVVEYLFVQMDRIGFFKSESSMFSSTDGSSRAIMTSLDLTDSESEETEEVDLESGDIKPPAGNSGPTCTDDFYVALRERLCKGHCRRLVAVKSKRSGA